MEASDSTSKPLKVTGVEAPFSKQTLTGALNALIAYSAWGLAPLYWKMLSTVPPPQLVSHRVLWSLVALLPILLLSKQWHNFLEVFRSPKRLLYLTVTATLLSANWLGFIFAIQNKMLLQASLGYFITPLLNVFLGRIFLKEKLRPIQQLAVALVCCGVLATIVEVHNVPWVALFIAFTFALYGLLRKIAPVEALVGLSIENVLLMPIAIGYLIYCQCLHQLVFFQDPRIAWLVPLSGPVTAVPLISFALAARGLRLSTLGFFQYLAPTIQLLLAIFAYGEDFTPSHQITFGLIWCALGIYLIDSIYASGYASGRTAKSVKT